MNHLLLKKMTVFFLVVVEYSVQSCERKSVLVLLRSESTRNFKQINTNIYMEIKPQHRISFDRETFSYL